MEFPTTFENGLTVVDIQNPRWTDEESIRIEVDVTFIFPEGPTETLPFTSCPWDTFGTHCPAIFEHVSNHMPPPAPYERRDVTVGDLQADLDKLMPDIMLGLATEQEIELARLIRTQIKVMTP